VKRKVKSKAYTEIKWLAEKHPENKFLAISAEMTSPDYHTLDLGGSEKWLHEAIRNKSQKSNAERAEVLAIREKFPELKALDEITRGLTVNDTDEELLDEYFTKRARDEGLI
jgi:hypothetical protein